jgi:hypothetical protein
MLVSGVIFHAFQECVTWRSHYFPRKKKPSKRDYIAHQPSLDKFPNITELKAILVANFAQKRFP